MATSFFNLSLEDQLELIYRTAEKLTVSAAVIEKDIWVCWVLEKIFLQPIKMTFKGGTSLSKASGFFA